MMGIMPCVYLDMTLQEYSLLAALKPSSLLDHCLLSDFELNNSKDLGKWR